MSFGSFIYYCAAWGAAAAFFGWVLGRALGADAPLLGAGIKGLSLGLFLAIGLGLVDGLAGAARRGLAALGGRLLVAGAVGAVGGLMGGFLGQSFYKLSDYKWSSLLVFGWTLTGTLIGAAPAVFDFVSAVLRNEDRRGVKRKLRNGLIGGAVGGLAGGIVNVSVYNAWEGLLRDTGSRELWSPSAAGFVALGACVGLAVALTHVILRDAWVRVEVGFRPGRQLLLTRAETTIGRAESCDVGLFGDTAAEKLHAKIVRAGERWFLTDLSGSAGTFLNGERIATPAPLNGGDTIRIGNSVLSFGVRTRTAAAPPPPLPPVT